MKAFDMDNESIKCSLNLYGITNITDHDNIHESETDD